MNEIILLHYPRSRVSEKVRVALGLTGGYRRTPIMQVGADT